MTTETLENDFVEVISTIADGLGIAAERIFAIFVSAQVMLGIIDIVSIALVILITLFSWWYTRRLCKKAWKDKDGAWEDDDKSAGAIWIPAAMAFVSLVITWEAMSVLGSAAMMILCPEYSAMIEIIERVMP